MYMHDKLANARGIIYSVGLVVVAVIVMWKLLIR